AEQTRSRESAEAANAANTSEKNSKMRKPKSNQKGVVQNCATARVSLRLKLLCAPAMRSDVD
ncbi:hypothetical protein, partial [Xanthomonas oryzae]